MVAKKKKRGITLRSIFTGSAVANELFIKRLPVLLFGAGLMMFYIGIGFRVQERHTELDRLNTQIKELRTVAVATTALRMELTRRETIERLLREKSISLIPLPAQPIILK